MRTIIGERKPYDRYDVRSRDCHATDAHVSYGKNSKGKHPTCLLKNTQSSFEKAHHWNIQSKFYSVKVPTQLYACMMISMEYKVYKMEYECGSLKRNSCVPPSLFLFSFSLFLFFYFLWPQQLFIFISHFVLFGIFSSLQGNTLYITKSIGDLSHFTKVLT